MLTSEPSKTPSKPPRPGSKFGRDFMITSRPEQLCAPVSTAKPVASEKERVTRTPYFQGSMTAGLYCLMVLLRSVERRATDVGSLARLALMMALLICNTLARPTGG